MTGEHPIRVGRIVLWLDYEGLAGLLEFLESEARFVGQITDAYGCDVALVRTPDRAVGIYTLWHGDPGWHAVLTPREQEILKSLLREKLEALRARRGEVIVA